jgi:hypothetical protein
VDIHQLFDVEQVPDKQVKQAGPDGERLEASAGAIAIHHERAQVQAMGRRTPRLVLLDILDLIVTRSEREKEFGSKRKSAYLMAPAWEHARRVLATKFCMRFATRHVVVDDAPCGMVNIEAPFPVV